jgi:hypothetical protein
VGYAAPRLTHPTNKKKGSGTPEDAWQAPACPFRTIRVRHRTSGRGARHRRSAFRVPPASGALAFRRSTAALAGPLSLPSSAPGQASWDEVHAGVIRAFRSQSRDSTSPTGRNAGRHDAQSRPSAEVTSPCPQAPPSLHRPLSPAGVLLRRARRVSIYSAGDEGQAISTGGCIVLIEQEIFARAWRDAGGRKPPQGARKVQSFPLTHCCCGVFGPAAAPTTQTNHDHITLSATPRDHASPAPAPCRPYTR